MQEYWEVLGLDAPPTDLKSAKRAYTAKLKVTRPDDDPEGFMLLRDALEIATHAPYDDTLSGPEVTSDHLFQGDVEQSSHNKTSVIEELSEPEIYTQSKHYPDIQLILDDSVRRNDAEVWTNYILGIGRESTLEEHSSFNNTLRQTLLQRLGYYDNDLAKNNFAIDPPFIETPVAVVIFKLMDWTEPQDHGYFIGYELEWLLQDFKIIKLNRVAHRPHSSEFKELMKDRSRRHEEAYNHSNYAIVEKFMIYGVLSVTVLVVLFLSN